MNGLAAMKHLLCEPQTEGGRGVGVPGALQTIFYAWTSKYMTEHENISFYISLQINERINAMISLRYV